MILQRKLEEELLGTCSRIGEKLEEPDKEPKICVINVKNCSRVSKISKNNHCKRAGFTYNTHEKALFYFIQYQQGNVLGSLLDLLYTADIFSTENIVLSIIL